MKQPKKSNCNCLFCNAKGDNETFKPYSMRNGMRAYFCSDECLNNTTEYDKQLQEIRYFIISCMSKRMNKSITTFTLNQLKKYSLQDLKMMETILKNKWRYINDFMNYKEIDNGMSEVKYILKMLETYLENEKREREFLEKNKVENNEGIETFETKTTVKKRKDISKWLEG